MKRNFRRKEIIKHISLKKILPRMYYLNLIMTKHQTNLNSVAFYKITRLYSEKCQGQERQRKAEELFLIQRN